MLILRILVGGILCLGLVACGEKQVRREGILLPYSEAAQLELQDVRKKYEGKDTPQFIQALNKFIEDYPDTSATTEAETLLAALEPKSAEPQPLPTPLVSALPGHAERTTRFRQCSPVHHCTEKTFSARSPRRSRTAARASPLATPRTTRATGY